MTLAATLETLVICVHLVALSIGVCDALCCFETSKSVFMDCVYTFQNGVSKLLTREGVC